ncbi:diguanylate cyclase [Cohnella sp. 56]|uniref:diguanylate cyclase n=1 Tax=Cohnella sp. 56 TaxID=3113722 RepID=UPI0030E84D87
MINTLIANFALLTAFLFFFNALFGEYGTKGDAPRRIIVYGAVSYGVFGLVLMYFSVRLDAHSLLDFRQLMIICSAAFGGLFASLITAAIVVIGRIVMFGGVNEASLIASASALVLAVGSGLLRRVLARGAWQFWFYSVLLCMVCTAITIGVLFGAQAWDILPPYYLIIIIGGIFVAGLTSYFSTANRLQLELSSSERRYRQLHILQESILQSASDVAIVAADLAGRITLFNRGAERLLGYEAGDVVGRFMPLADAADEQADKPRPNRPSPASTDALTAFVQRMMLRTGEGQEWTIERRDGSSFVANVIVSHVRDSDGGVIGYMSVSTDITERKLAEEKLKEANSLLQRLSLLDGLTGIPNRRRFDQDLHAAWTTARAQRGRLSLIMFDIDFFKKYNDAYGHQAGDECLIRVASASAGCLRGEADMVARYGGEEFGVIMPGAGADEAAALAEQIRAAVVALAIPHSGSSEGIVSLSLGVACAVPDDSGGERQLIAQADAALYEAKQAGRNRVTSASAVEQPAAGS